MQYLVFMLVLSLGALPLLAEQPGRAPIPEPGLVIHSCAYYFKRWDPKDFKVARPETLPDTAHFKTSDLFYQVNAGVAQVFAQYMKINPLKIWSSARCTIRAVWVPSLGRTLHRKDLESTWPGFEVGMNVFVDMASQPVAVTNFPAIMVGLRIVRLDAATRTVEFQYLEGTPSYGRQVIQFEASPDSPGVTAISHRTWFRSYNALIERLYPMYHRKMIDNMHARFRHEIE